MTHPNHYTREELLEIGVRSVGNDVAIDRTCRLYGASNMRFGSHVRIDAYSVLSAGEEGLQIGDYVHLSAHVTIVGRGAVRIGNFVALSVRATIFTSNDDYSGHAMANPTIPDEFRLVHTAPVIVDDHVIVGSGSIILPGVTLARGAAIGALSLVKHSVAEFTIAAGQPAVALRERSRDLVLLEQRFKQAIAQP